MGKTCTCKRIEELPDSFRDLGMQDNIAAIFDAAKVTPKTMLKQARDTALSDELIFKEDGRCYLNARYPRQWEKLIPTGLEARRVVGNVGDGIGWTDAYDAGHLRVNFFMVGVPYLADFIRKDSRAQFERIQGEYYPLFIHGSFYMDNNTIRHLYHQVMEYCILHYDCMEKIHINQEPTEKKLRELFEKSRYAGRLEEYDKYLAAARACKGKFKGTAELPRYPEALMNILRSFSQWSEVYGLIDTSLYVQE